MEAVFGNVDNLNVLINEDDQTYDQLYQYKHVSK